MTLGISDDYAVLEADGTELYYGYEVTVGNEDEEVWCFRAQKAGSEVVIIPATELPGVDERTDPSECPPAGIGVLIERGWLEVKRGG